MLREGRRLYSDKALNIIRHFIDDARIARSADGEIKLKVLDELHVNSWIDCIAGKLRPIKAMAAVEGGFISRHGTPLTYRDMNLLRLISLDNHNMKTIRKYFGDESVDEMIGQPATSNPIAYYKNKTIQAELDKIEAKRQKRRLEVMNGLQLEVKAIKAECKPAMEELELKIKKLQAELMQLQIKQDQRIDEAKRKTEPILDGIDEEFGAKKADLEAKLLKGE